LADLIEAILILKHGSSSAFEGEGRCQFRVLPRVGEHIDIDVEVEGEPVGYSYRVVAVHHPKTPASTAGDIYAVRDGVTSDLIRRL
jgi:hypothetical protein